MRRLLIMGGLMIAWFGSNGQSSMAARTAIATNLPDNATKTITPALLRSSLTAMVDLIDQKVSSQWQNQTGNFISFPGYARVAMMRLDAYNAAALGGFPGGNAGMLAYQSDGLRGLYVNDGTAFRRVSPWTDATSGSIAYEGDLRVGTAGTITVGKGNSSVSTNTGVGANVLSVNTTVGAENTGIGFEAIKANQNGLYNTAIGASALKAAVNTINNVAIGRNAQMSNASGSHNTAIGTHALISNTAGSSNTAVGRLALSANKGSENTAIGANAGESVTTGVQNTFVGTGSGGNITTGRANTIIGAYVSNLPDNLSNNIIIADGDGNRRINVNATGNVGIGTNSPSAKLHVAGNVRIDGGNVSIPSNRLIASELEADYSTANVLVLNDNLTYAHPTKGNNKMLKSDADGNAEWATVQYTKSFNVTVTNKLDSIVVQQAEHNVIAPNAIVMRGNSGGVMMLPYKINSATKRCVVYFPSNKTYVGSFTIF